MKIVNNKSKKISLYLFISIDLRRLYMEYIYKLMAIKQENRVETAVQVQELLTKHGCTIKVRLGLHEIVGDACSAHGLIILELVGDEEEVDNLMFALNHLNGVVAKKLLI